jgi:cysteine-rich repeat protein
MAKYLLFSCVLTACCESHSMERDGEADRIEEPDFVDQEQDGNDRDVEGEEDCAEIPSVCGDGVHDPGEECDDGNDFPGDGCEADCTFTCEVSTQALDCDDALACTEDLCDGATYTCSNPVRAGYCLIGGVCYADGDDNPLDQCQECMSGTDQTGWTDKAWGKLGADVRITDNSSYSGWPDIVFTGSEYGVAWSDHRDGDSEIYFARIGCMP